MRASLLRIMLQRFSFIIAFSTLQVWCGEQEYYRQFVAVLNTNDVWGYAITSPLLVDTNNTTTKLTNAVLDFATMSQRGEIAGVRLRMSMEEVVGALGKPPVFWSANRGGGPCFDYGGLAVVFEPSSNSVRRIFVPRRLLESVRFESGLSLRSSMDDWIHVVGEPTTRGEWHAPDAIVLAYEKPNGVSLLVFDAATKKLGGVRLERAPRDGDSN